MTVPLDREHLALLRRQGAAWISRLAELEHWLDASEADALAALQACPDAGVADHVEALRSRMWDVMQRHRAVPTFERTVNGQPIAPPAPLPRRPRGLAKHLARKQPIPKSAQVDLFPKGRR